MGFLAAYEGCLYIGTSKGIFKTKGGRGYFPPVKSYGLKGKNVASLCFHNGYLYAGTKYSGVFRKGLDENDWVHIGLAFEHVKTLASHNGELYAGVEGGRIFVSDGMLVNWKPSKQETKMAHSFHLYQDALYVKSEDRILKTKDGEKWPNVWHNVQKDKKEKFPKPHMLCTKYLEDQGSRLYTVTEEGQIYELDYCFNYGKECWRKHRKQLELKNQEITAFFTHQGGFYIGTSKGLYRLEYNAKSKKDEWKLMDDQASKLRELKVNSFYADGDDLYISTENGVYKKTGGNIMGWESVGLEGKDIDSLYFRDEIDNTGSTYKYLYVSSEKQGALKLNLKTKQVITTLPYKNVKTFYDNGRSLFAGTAAGKILVTRNNGKTWPDIAQIDELLDFYLYNGNLYVGTTESIYKQQIK